MARMRTVRVRAFNLKVDDVVNGQRIVKIHRYKRRVRRNGPYHKTANYGVVALAPNPSGYNLDVLRFIGDEFIVVKRPRRNMKYAKK